MFVFGGGIDYGTIYNTINNLTMGKIINYLNYLDVKPKEMSVKDYVEYRLKKFFGDLVYVHDSNVYCEPTKIDIESFESGFWIFKSTYQQWKYRKLFKVLKIYGDIHIISYTPELNQELIFSLFGEEIKDLNEDIVFREEGTEYVKVNNKPIYEEYGAF